MGKIVKSTAILAAILVKVTVTFGIVHIRTEESMRGPRKIRPGGS